MKKLVLFKRIVLILMLIGMLVLASCSFRGCSSKCNHEWGEGILINATECGKGAIARVTCSICGETEEVSAETHNYVAGEKIVPTCTSMGYTQYDCMYCNASCVSDFVNALGHKYGEELTVKQETCTTSGSYVQICENCGDVYSYSHNAKGHSYQLVSEDDANTTFECDSCHDIVVLEKEQSIEEFIGNEELFDVESSFAFDIISTDTEDVIRDKLKIIYFYFNQTEYENHEEIIHQYNLEYKGDNIWTVSPTINYDYDTTYIVKLSDGISFSEYNGSELIFTVIEDPNHENVTDYQDSIVFLQDLENNTGGYYPYAIATTDESEQLYVTLGKVDDLAIDMIICVGNITSIDEITNETECYFGKIKNIYTLPDGRFMLVLAEPDITDIFANLDVNYNDKLTFEDDDINIEEIENDIVNALWNNDEFIQFVSVLNLSTNEYFTDNGYYAEELANVDCFLEKFKITPKVRTKDTKIIGTLDGYWGLPIRDKNKEEIGHFGIYFTFEFTTEFALDINYAIKWKWKIIPKGIKYFDLGVTQTTNFDFSFGVEIDVKKSNDEQPYVHHIGTDKIHRASCPHLQNVSDFSKLKGLNAVEAEKKITENPNLECKNCQPIKGFKNDILVINTKESTIHAYDCPYVSKMSESNKLLSEKSIKYWLELDVKYTCCDWCHPDSRIDETFEAYYASMLYCSDWQKVATDISAWLQSSDIKPFEQDGVTLIHKDFNIPHTPIMFTIDLNFVLEFKIEASLNYHFSLLRTDKYGIHITSNSIGPYMHTTNQILENSLRLMGNAEAKAYLMADINIHIFGLQKWIRAGVNAQAGLYAQMSGIVSVSLQNDENYAAAFFQVGAFVKVDAYYNLFKLSGTVTIVEEQKWPFFTMGYEKAYFGYLEYKDKLEIMGSYNVDENNLLAVKYFSLEKMTVQTDELSLYETEKYKVNIEFSDGSYCEIKDGKIVAKSNAPCYFKDKITITVDCDDSWKDFKKDSSVYYLGTYEIEIEFYSDNDHTYDSDTDNICNLCGFERTIACYHTETIILTAIVPTCTETGLTEGKKCLACDKIIVEQMVLPANGHTVVIDPGVEATCTSTGLTEGKHCSVCNAILVRQTVIEILDHVYSVVITPPTCTQKGYTIFTCICGDTHVGNYTDTIPHDYSAVIVEPTCTENGYATYTCSCGDSYVEKLDAKGHTVVIDEAVAPTCTSTGLTEGKHCSVCSTVIETQTVIDIIDCIESDWIVDVPATKTEDGSHHTECTMCGTKISEETIPATGSLGLEYTLNGDGKSYSVTGIGTCTDTDVIIPDTYEGLAVTIIGGWAFQDFAYIKSVYIPDSVKQIGSYAFSGCTSLVSINIPTSVKTITHYVFAGCTSLININIPTSVTSIGMSAFENCTSLTSISLPSSVNTIHMYAFRGCLSLTNITIPNSVTSIDSYVFGDCIALESVVLSDSIDTIAWGMFYGCTSLISINIPDTVTNIDSSAFSGCSSLTNVNIPNSVTRIGMSAFKDCTSLTSVAISNSVTLIDQGAFRDCTSLTRVTMGNSVMRILNSAFYNCTSLTNITIPNSVIDIGMFAFYNCTSLTSIEIPDSVTSVGDDAFHACKSLTSIEIPDSVTSVGDYALYNCTSLESISFKGTIEQWNAISKGSYWSLDTGIYIIYCTDGEIAKDGMVTYYPTASEGLEFTLNADGQSYSVTGIGTCSDTDVIIPDTYIGLPVKSIGSSAFSNCTTLTSIEIPDSVTSIGREAFAWCTSLESIEIPDSVTSIGGWAFFGCTLFTSIEIPDSVTSIGYNGAFGSCSSLTSIDVDANNQYYQSIDGNLYTKDGKTLMQYAIGKDATTFTIPDTVESIGGSAFDCCTSLKSIVIPNSVKSIGDGVFYNCTSLTSIEIPDSVTNIGEWAFYSCDSLTSIEISDSVTSIGNFTFSGCTSLTSIVIPDSVTSIGSDAFYYCTSLTSIVIPDSVTSIGSDAFRYCTSLTSIEIPDSVTSISYGAFSGCTSLTSIDVDANNQYYQSMDGNLYTKDGKTLMQYAIGKDATTFTIPDSVTSIGREAFAWCTSLESIEIPDSVTSIGSYAFSSCASLTSITIPDSVTSIGSYAFSSCASLTSITIPDSVTSIGSYAFSSCASLTSITIPDSVTSIGGFAFSSCASLTSITIPDSVTSIGSSAFMRCRSLTSINFDCTVEQWNVIEKGTNWDSNTGAYTIYCTDGEIAKDGTVTYY